MKPTSTRNTTGTEVQEKIEIITAQIDRWDHITSAALPQATRIHGRQPWSFGLSRGKHAGCTKVTVRVVVGVDAKKVSF